MKRSLYLALLLLMSMVVIVSPNCASEKRITPPSVLDDEHQAPQSNTLYVMQASVLSRMSIGSQLAFQSLQGIVNQQYPPQIFIATNDGDRHDMDWVNLLTREYDVTSVRQDDFLWYFASFRPQLQGYLLCDYRRPESILVALSLSGLLQSVVVEVHDSSLIQVLQDQGLSLALDVRARDSVWLTESEYWPQLNKDGIVQLHPLASLPNLRDFGVAHKMAFFFNDPRRDREFQLMQRMIAGQRPGSIVYGWGYVDRTFQESGFVGVAAAAGLGTVPTDEGMNLSVYGHYGLRRPLTPPPAPPLPTNTRVHYVAFVMSDGDNAQLILNKFAHPSHDLYASPRRGELPIGWTLPPTLADIAPPIMEWVYRQATPNDYLLAGPSGWAYLYPSMYPDPARLTAMTEAALDQTGFRSAVILDPNGGQVSFRNTVLDPLTRPENMLGLFYSAYDWADPPPNSILWSNGKPVIPVTRLGYLKPAAEEVNALAAMINRRARDATTPAGYTVVYAHLSGTQVSDLIALAQRLDPGVVVVRPDVLLQLISRHVPH